MPFWPIAVIPGSRKGLDRFLPTSSIPVGIRKNGGSRVEPCTGALGQR